MRSPLKANGFAGPRPIFSALKKGICSWVWILRPTDWGRAFKPWGTRAPEVACLGIDQLNEAVRKEDCEDALARRIDSWTRGLARGLTRDILPRPRPDLLLEADKEQTADKDRIAVPAEGGIWVQFLERSGLFISTEEVVPADTFVPLSEFSWLLMLKDSRVRTASTRQILDRGLVWSSLAAFHAMIFQTIFLNAGLKAADVYNLLADREAEQMRDKQDGLASLASVMGHTGPADSCIPENREDQLAWAVSQAAGVLGLTVTPPRPPAGEAAAQPTVEDIARASHFNVRRVILEAGWWRQDIGPMVGFTVDGSRPVPLIPVSAGRYETEDPKSGKKMRITTRTAKTISGARAYTFYRPFPDRPLTGMDLFKFGLKGCKKDLIQIFALAVAIGLSSLVVPMATGLVFSDIIPSADRIRVWGIAAILLGFGLTTILFEITRNIALLRVETRLHYALESALWDRLLRLSLPFFRQFETGDLTTRAMGMFMIRQLVSGPVITTILGSLISLFNLILLFYYHVPLAWLATGILLFGAMVTAGLSLWQLRYVRQQAGMEGEISGRVMQFLSAITKLKISGAEDNAFASWARAFGRQQKYAFKGGRVQNILATFMGGFWLFAQMLIFSWLIFKAGDSALGTGEFLAFNAAFAALSAGMVQMLISLTQFIMAIPYYERLKPVLAACPETDSMKADPGSLSGKVEICHINFRYTPDGPMILKDVSLSVEPGTFVAIVGSSGSGKSTLVRMLLGFEQAESGTVFYDDHDLSDLDVRQVRQIMGVVVQGGNLMAGDLFTNIIGSHPLTLDDAWEAAVLAGLDQDIKEMPMGMHTVVMEGASTLSGGQRQRLMIARAIVNRPRILILDEATSALDNRTQALVGQSLARLKATRIVVAHRLSTIKDADIIHVMDKGEIKESGSFDVLMAKEDSLFRKLAERQML